MTSTRRVFLQARAGGRGRGGRRRARRGHAEPGLARRAARPGVSGGNRRLHHAAGARRADDLYIFGFKEVGPDDSLSAVVTAAKGKAQMPSPILVHPGHGFQLSLTNVGFVGRPDLDDSHTIHWHGFRDAIPIFDGTPEMSIAVRSNRSSPYFYAPHHPGTYKYHCHFEDFEHVQMGMTGIVFVRPTMGAKYAYNDASTAFDREFSLLLNEIGRPRRTTADRRSRSRLDRVRAAATGSSTAASIRRHDQAEQGRARRRPQPRQPADLVADPGQSGRPGAAARLEPRLRAALDGAARHHDEGGWRGRHAPRGPLGADLSYETNTVYIGPGETRDVLFDAPAFDAGSASRDLQLRLLEHVPVQEPQLRPADERRSERSRGDGHRGAGLHPANSRRCPRSPTT